MYMHVQAKSWTEQLLLEMTVLGSWITEAELSMQALDKKSKKPNGITSKLLDTRTVCPILELNSIVP